MKYLWPPYPSSEGLFDPNQLLFCEGQWSLGEPS